MSPTCKSRDEAWTGDSAVYQSGVGLTPVTDPAVINSTSFSSDNITSPLALPITCRNHPFYCAQAAEADLQFLPYWHGLSLALPLPSPGAGGPAFGFDFLSNYATGVAPSLRFLGFYFELTWCFCRPYGTRFHLSGTDPGLKSWAILVASLRDWTKRFWWRRDSFKLRRWSMCATCLRRYKCTYRPSGGDRSEERDLSHVSWVPRRTDRLICLS